MKLTKEQIKQCDQVAKELLELIDDKICDILPETVEIDMFEEDDKIDLAYDKVYEFLKQKLGGK